MEAKNYRVGNHVLTATPGMPIKIPSFRASVQGITLFGELMFCHKPDSQGFETHANHVCGIDLCHDELINCGFTKISEDVYQLDSGAFGFEWIAGEGLYVDGVGVEIDYVHQMQNLFFALRQEELPMKNEC